MSIAEHVTGLQHLGLPTAALDETAAFYESLGFVRAHSTVNPGTGERVCFLTCGGLCIETYECAAPARRPGAIDHLALDVDDIESAWEEVRMAGLAPLEDAIQFLPFWENGVRFFNLLGPNGETVEFSQSCRPRSVWLRLVSSAISDSFLCAKLENLPDPLAKGPLYRL